MALTQRGFSLLELLTVMTLIAILAGIGVLNHHALRARLNLRTAARQIVMDLKVARMRAVATNSNHRIRFRNADYQRQRKKGDQYADDGPAVPLPTGIAITDCTANDDAISFRPRGNASSFGAITIGNQRGDVRRIVVDIAGQIRVE
jgi:prepilin peptidase dependent protein A